MAHIILIQPKTPLEYISYKSFNKFTKKPALLPPLGLMTIAALTPNIHTVQIIDERIESINFETSCDIVGITGYRFYKNRMIEISNKFKKRGILTVAGGPYCTDYFEEAQQYFDVVITGEAELTWPIFLSDWDKGIYKEKYIQIQSIEMNNSPTPRWDLVQTEKYTMGSIQTSRGCLNNCEYCNVVKLYGRKLRTKNCGQIMREIQVLALRGFPTVFFVDDNFTGNRQNVKALLRDIIQFNHLRKNPLVFVAQTSLDLAEDDELLDLLKEANFFQLFIGIETPREKSLITCNKQHNLKLKMSEAIKKIQSRGMFIVAGMIVGFDTDDIDIFEEHEQFLKKNGITLAMINLLVATRNTRMWHRLKNEGRLLEHVSEDSFLAVNYIPLLMSKEKLEIEHHKLLQRVCSIEHFKVCFLTFIEQLDTSLMQHNSKAATWIHIRTLDKSLILTGMRVVKYYLFQAGSEKRRLFVFVLKHTIAKGLICLPVVISIMSYYESLNQYIICKVAREK